MWDGRHFIARGAHASALTFPRPLGGFSTGSHSRVRLGGRLPVCLRAVCQSVYLYVCMSVLSVCFCPYLLVPLTIQLSLPSGPSVVLCTRLSHPPPAHTTPQWSTTPSRLSTRSAPRTWRPPNSHASLPCVHSSSPCSPAPVRWLCGCVAGACVDVWLLHGRGVTVSVMPQHTVTPRPSPVAAGVLFEGLADESEDEVQRLVEDMFLFCFCWGIGGNLNSNG